MYIIARQTPTASTTLANFRTAAELNSGSVNQWEVMDYLAISAVQLLLLLEYGSFRTCAPTTGLLGQGIIVDAAAHPTGQTSTYGNTSYGSAANQTTAMSYRGIENFYGNLNKLVEGINLDGTNVWVADHNFVSSFGWGAPYVNTLLTYASTANWMSDITTNATYDYGFLASAVSGTATTDLCSYFAGNSATNEGVYFSGDYEQGVSILWAVLNPNGYSAAYVGARLMYIG